MKEKKLSEFLQLIQNEITFNGSKRIKLSVLIRKFGKKNKNSTIVKVINDFLKDNNLFAYPEIDTILKKDEWIIITNKKIKKSTNFFKTENELESFLDDNKDVFKSIDVEIIDRQKIFKGARDKVDFFGLYNKENVAIIEVKHTSSYYGIEQLLRYKGILKNNPKLIESDYKKYAEENSLILITGIEDPRLHHTFRGMEDEQRKHFKWYIYDYNKNTITFIPIEFS